MKTNEINATIINRSVADIGFNLDINKLKMHPSQRIFFTDPLWSEKFQYETFCRIQSDRIIESEGGHVWQP